MQIAVRSYLTAGTVAVVGAGAIALTPVVTPAAVAVQVPVPAVAEVALSGLSLSLTDVVGLLQGLGIGGGLPQVLSSLGSLLPTDIVTAVVNEFVNQASPLVFAAAGEVFTYVGTAITGLITSIPLRFGDALAAIPGTLVSAVQSLATGDLATALQAVSDGLAGPAAGIAAALSEAGAAFQDFLATEFNGLVGALPGLLFAAVQKVVTTNLQSLIDSIGGALSGLFGGLIPGAGAATVAAATATAGTIVCNMPAIRTASALPAAAEVPASVDAAAKAPAAAVVVDVPQALTAVSVVETRSAATASTTRSRGGAPKPAATVADTAAADTPAAAPARSATGKAGAERGGRESAR